MVKKEGISIGTKTTSKKPKTIKKNSITKLELEQALIDNFINLQKVLTNLSIKFEDLSNNMSKMLQLFEISAKSFADKNFTSEEKSSTKSDKQLLEKLDSLLDQNKTIAKGILLMEDRIRKRTPVEYPPTPELQSPFQEQSENPNQFIRSKPLPKL